MAPQAPPEVAALLSRSNRLGSDPRNTNYAGGNTSAKGEVTDPVTGQPAGVLWVKGSGGDLGTLTEDGLAVLRLDRVRALTGVYPGVEREDEMVAAFDYCLHGLGGVVGSGPAQRGAAPSIDTAMHGLVDAAQVPARAGAAEENEDTHPFVVSIEDAVASLEQGQVANALLVSALQWLALHRERLKEYLDRASVVDPAET